MKRIQNIDKIRAIACLLVLVYHCWALCGSHPIHIPVIREYITYGGTIGVTAFFILSGYGIYSSLHATELSDHKISFKNFMTKRIKRIVPHYYFNILIALLFTGSAVYLTRDHLTNIISHLFFFHSFSLDWHGAINGVLWTMAVIFQFYLIAIPLYYFVKKFKIWSVLLIILTTIIAQFLTLNHLWIIDENVYGSFAFSIPGRQLWTSLDNFVIGMYVAHLAAARKETKHYIPYTIGFLGCVILIYLQCLLGNRYGVWGRNLWNCSYHSLLAILIGLLIFCACNMQNSMGSPFSRILLWIAKYEYGIYLWHLLIINNLLANSGLLKELLAHQKPFWVYIILISCSILVGYIMTHLLSRQNISRK